LIKLCFRKLLGLTHNKTALKEEHRRVYPLQWLVWKGCVAELLVSDPLCFCARISYEQCFGSVMFIPDLGFFHPESRIWIFPSRILNPEPHHWIKNLSIFHPQKLLLSSRKYDARCLSGIWILDPDFFFHPGSRSLKKLWIPDPESVSPTLGTKGQVSSVPSCCLGNLVLLPCDISQRSDLQDFH
jgi:hypothetical protein